MTRLSAPRELVGMLEGCHFLPPGVHSRLEGVFGIRRRRTKMSRAEGTGTGVTESCTQLTWPPTLPMVEA